MMSADAAENTRDMAAIADGEREVRCILKQGGVIAAGSCLEGQEKNLCFCPAAYGALRGTESLLGPNAHPQDNEGIAHLSKQRIRLAMLKARAAGFAKKKQEYSGPALSLMNAELERRAKERAAKGPAPVPAIPSVKVPVRVPAPTPVPASFTRPKVPAPPAPLPVSVPQPEAAKPEVPAPPPTRYGYRSGPNGMEPLEAEQLVIRTVLALEKEGKSPARITRELHQQGLKSRAGKSFHQTQVARILQYAGIVPNPARTVTNAAPAPTPITPKRQDVEAVLTVAGISPNPAHVDTKVAPVDTKVSVKQQEVAAVLEHALRKLGFTSKLARWAAVEAFRTHGAHEFPELMKEALRIIRGPPSNPGVPPKPAAAPTAVRLCSFQGCSTRLRTDNESGLCEPHRRIDRSRSAPSGLRCPKCQRKRYKLMESGICGTCENSLQQKAPDRTCEDPDGCTEHIAARNKTGLCDRHASRARVNRHYHRAREIIASSVALPAPAELPHDYLVRCVEEAMRRRESFTKAIFLNLPVHAPGEDFEKPVKPAQSEVAASVKKATM